jgi:hypothetical protein
MRGLGIHHGPGLCPSIGIWQNHSCTDFAVILD